MMKTILVFGDSNSYGTPGMADLGAWGRFGAGERWPGVMAKTLGTAWTLIEEALPGRTTVHDDPIEGACRNGLKALPMVLGSHRPIDLLVIKLGTNDLKARFSVTAADIAASVGVLVDLAKASFAGPDGTPPAILVISPAVIAEVGVLGPMFSGGTEKSRALGTAMADMARRRGVAFLDAAPLISSDPVDGIHLTVDQHAVLGLAVAAEVKHMFADA